MIEKLPGRRNGYRNPETDARIYIKQHYGTVKGKRVAYIVKLEKPNGNKVTIDGDTKYGKVEDILENHKDKIETGYWKDEPRRQEA